MLNTCVTSRISLRTRGSSSYSTNDYSYCSNETHPFTYSSSRQCCSCCSYTMYKVPLTPSYCYNLYGLRQSSLIQWSPYRRLIRGGLDRCYNARLPVCDVDGSCFCDRICNFMEKSVGLRKGGLRKCLVYEERSERYDFGGFDEAEAILSLLTDDVDEECFRVTKETRRLVKKPVVEKRENGVVSNKYGSEKKKVDLNDLDSEHRCECGSSVVRSRKKDNRRGEIIRRKEDKEALLREENERVALREEHKIASLKNRVAREKEERGALLRKKSQEAEEKKERESMLRKVRSRTEDREDLLREEHRQKLKKDGSSCSSYYSFSSTGDNEGDNEIERAEGRLWLDSSSGHKRNSRSNEIVYEDSKVEDQRHEDYREDNVVRLTKKSTGKELYTGSSVFESDHRKKSEKSFADVSVEEIESRRRISQKESNISVAHENNLKKCSDYYVSYDDTKVKSTGSTKLDQESRQQLRQTDEGVSRQSESRMKYKQLAERQETLNDDVRASYGSQKVYSGKSEMSAKVASSSQETVAEQKAAVGLGTREDRYQRNSRKVAEVSEIQETDITKTSISQQSFETNFKEENYSTNILSSINSATKQQQQQQQQHQQQQQQQQQQRDQVSALIDSRSKSQQLTKNDAKSILKGESDKRIRKEENMNLVHGSSSESQERRSQLRAKIITNESDESTKILVSGSGNSGAIDIEERNDTITETPAITPSHSPEIGMLSPWSGAGIATNDVREGSLQFGSTELLGTDPERSSEFHRKALVGAKSKGSQGQPSKFISHEDAIESAALLEKSSAHYVDQFVDQVRNEILISETQREKKTSETKSVHEEQQKQKNSAQYISGDYQPEEQRVLIGDDRRSGRKGPTDEMWSVNEPSNQDPSRAEAPDNASEAGTAIAKRTGRSLWNVFADVVRLRWSPHSESHSSGRKTVERSSPNQSTSSETWFSGHEAEQHEEATEEKEGRSITQGSSGSYQEEKTGSIVEEGSSSSTSEGHLKHVGINEPSSSVILGRVSPPISLPSGGEIPDRSFGGTSSNPIVHFSVPLPSMRMRRSPAMLRGDLEAGEANASKSGMSEQLNSGLVEKQESAINEGELKRRKLQRKDQMAQDRFDEWEDAYRLDAEQRKIDETFMREALLEAQKAADKWEVPVGAVLVHNGKIIARGYNLVEELRDSTAHAEIICIRDASNILKTWRLSETTLYVTLEPCPMCAGAILQARIDVVVWGAPNKLLGADGSWIRLFPSGDGGNSLEQSDKPPAPVHPFHPKIIIRRGVLASECADAMQYFFKLRRKDKKTVPSSSTSASPPTCLPITHRPSSSRFLAKMHNAFNLLFCL